MEVPRYVAQRTTCTDVQTVKLTVLVVILWFKAVLQCEDIAVRLRR